MPANRAQTRAAKPRQPAVAHEQQERIAQQATVEDSTAERGPTLKFPVIAAGASAGGIKAFSELLDHLPSDIHAALVYIQHLDPRRRSALTEVVARHTAMPVVTAESGMRLEAKHVYVIPPDATMTVTGGILKLEPRGNDQHLHFPVDAFLRSLAGDQGSQAIGVVLSGAASDGTLGLRAVKAAGGITFAQDEASAEHDGMPRSAVVAGCADRVLPPAEIAREIAGITAHSYIGRKQAEEAMPAGAEAALSAIFALLRTHTGVDFSFYKSSTVKRRIARRMALHRVEGVEQYLTYLRGHKEEIRALYDDILINVTGFFRDPDTFEALKKTVFPRIFDRRREGPVRVWAPGCATGEEPYSIAIAILEFLGERAEGFEIQIFASDISERALAQARAGVYPESIARDVSAERLRRFFVKLQPGYQISKRIRDMCVFSRQNLARDPPFSRIDLIGCRHLLIHLGPVLQRRILPVFHYALKPSGFLVLGSSASIGDHAEMFASVDKKHNIYTRKAAASRIPLDFTVSDQGYEPPQPVLHGNIGQQTELLREADRAVLSRYTPPGVVIDDDLNILQFRGRTGPYLEPASGTASLNLLRMAREALAVELRNTVQKARKQNAPVRREDLHVMYGGELKHFDIEVVPLKRSPDRERRFLVVFDERQAALPARAQKARGTKPGSKGERELHELERELEATNEYLQSIIEAQEASNEELRAANEDIQSSNEELQSINEELETAKEDLQSANEELNTVNEELHTRNLQLTQAGNDLLNLLSNISIPVVMLSNDLRIRRFTPVSEEAFNLIPTDVGRPISDIKFKIDVPNLEALLKDVLKNLTAKTVEVKDANGHAYSLRVRPYRTENNQIDGVVMVLVDMDPARNLAPENETAPDPQQVMLGLTESVREEKESLSQFAAKLIAAHEEERRRVARELHDDMNQRLALLGVELSNVEGALTAAGWNQEQVNRMRSCLTDLAERTRQIAYELHPSIIEDLGLIPAIENFCQQYAEIEKIRVDFRHSAAQRGLPRDVALCLYRVVQESLRNIAKHAQAEHVSVRLMHVDSAVHLTVKDDGIGFEMEKGEPRRGLGITGMEERARLQGGTLAIRSKPEHGTEVSLQIPLRNMVQTAADS